MILSLFGVDELCFIYAFIYIFLLVHCNLPEGVKGNSVGEVTTLVEIAS